MYEKQTVVTPVYTIPHTISERPLDIMALGSLVMERIIQVEKWPETRGQDVVPVKSISDTSGGCAMNVACFAGRQGGKTAVISGIGDGQYSRITWDELAVSGVDTTAGTTLQQLLLQLLCLSGSYCALFHVLDYIDP